MSTDRLTVTLNCKKCGGTVLELPDDHTDDSIAKCKSCHTELGRWGDIQTKAREMALDKARAMLRAPFEGKKGWTVKKDGAD